MNPSPFVSLVRSAADELGLAGHPVLVGVSGGADSVALLRALLELRDELRLTVPAAHLNHQLRGATTATDAD